MSGKEKIQLIGIAFLALMAYLVFAKVSYMERGYWAVGGEMFVPIGILTWGIYSIFKEDKDSEEEKKC